METTSPRHTRLKVIRALRTSGQIKRSFVGQSTPFYCIVRKDGRRLTATFQNHTVYGGAYTVRVTPKQVMAYIRRHTPTEVSEESVPDTQPAGSPTRSDAGLRSDPSETMVERVAMMIHYGETPASVRDRLLAEGMSEYGCYLAYMAGQTYNVIDKIEYIEQE